MAMQRATQIPSRLGEVTGQQLPSNMKNSVIDLELRTSFEIRFPEQQVLIP